MLRRALLCSAVAAACCGVFAASEAQAQVCGLQQGYGFGVGLQNNYVHATRLLAPHDRPPHFALYPPVYYSDVITPRPYGISPFAAPPGIRPVELDMLLPPEPVTVDNPFFTPNDGQPAEPSPSDREPAAEESSDAQPQPPRPITHTTHPVATQSAPKSTFQVIHNPFYVGNSVAVSGR